jgi:orotate phosphoribosyltransferase
MSSLIMSKDRVMELLQRSGAYREGHFEHPQGYHTPHYFQMPLALRYADNARVLSVSLSRMLRRSRELLAALPQVSVVAPGSGGVPVAFEIRSVLGAEQIFWAEREGGEVRFRQYNEIKPGQKCVIVDDIARSGSTINQVHRMITEAGGEVLAIGVLVRHDLSRIDVPDVPVYALLDFEATRYASKAACPLCAEGVPVEQVRF